MFLNTSIGSKWTCSNFRTNMARSYGVPVLTINKYIFTYFKDDSAVLVADDSCSATYVVLSLISDKPLSPDLRSWFSLRSDLTSA